MKYTRTVMGAGKRRIAAAMLAASSLIAMVQPTTAQVNKTTLKLHPNPKSAACFASPSGLTPETTVTVVRGSLADTLYTTGKNFQPNQGFDLFTMQRSELLADAQLDPKVTNFGQAWYQTDLKADATGSFKGSIKTILLDQIFGFDPDVNLTPTQALHVGIWFDNPNDAAPCGFDVTKPTLFNGQHQAGLNAMISVPNAATDLGPLCTAPILQNGTYVCNINK